MNGKNEPIDGSKLPPAFITQFDYHSQNSRKEQIMNPEAILKEVRTAIKHRCISSTGRWQVVYYYTRICCVPSHENVPPEIVLCEFSEKDVQEGFELKIWTELLRRIVETYKELHK